MTGILFALFANDMTGENIAGFRPPFSGNQAKYVGKPILHKPLKG